MFGVCEVRDRTVLSMVDDPAKNRSWRSHQICYMVFVYSKKEDAAVALAQLSGLSEWRLGPMNVEVSLLFDPIPPMQYMSSISI